MVAILYSSDSLGGKCARCGAECGELDHTTIIPLTLIEDQIPFYCDGCNRIIDAMLGGKYGNDSI